MPKHVYMFVRDWLLWQSEDEGKLLLGLRLFQGTSGSWLMAGFPAKFDDRTGEMQLRFRTKAQVGKLNSWLCNPALTSGADEADGAEPLAPASGGPLQVWLDWYSHQALCSMTMCSQAPPGCAVRLVCATSCLVQTDLSPPRNLWTLEDQGSCSACGEGERCFTPLQREVHMRKGSGQTKRVCANKMTMGCITRQMCLKILGFHAKHVPHDFALLKPLLQSHQAIFGSADEQDQSVVPADLGIGVPALELNPHLNPHRCQHDSRCVNVVTPAE